MTATRKLFAAAALVAAGFGVASLLGEPAAQLRAPLLAGAPIQTQAASAPVSNTPSAAPYASSNVRLVPDFGTAAFDKLEAAPLLVDVAPSKLPGAIAGDATVGDEAPGLENPNSWKVAPRAKLRNEAPRPLAIDSAVPTTFGVMPPAASASVQSSTHAPPSPDAPSSWPTGDTASARFEQAPAAIPTIVASYHEAPGAAADIGPINPPPWPAPDDAAGLRTHIVIDGDSLSRLAGRYLDDARRGDEIFEANRGLLADPDLLPIGAELTIPSRTATSRPGFDSPHSFAPRAVAIHAAAGGRLVPVRPVPSSAGVVPRAQLSRPLPVE